MKYKNTMTARPSTYYSLIKYENARALSTSQALIRYTQSSIISRTVHIIVVVVPIVGGGCIQIYYIV